MDFPKNRDGWSGPGRTAARTIAGDDLWLRKRRFDAEARNKGGHLLVTNAPPVTTDGWYTLGTEGGTPVIRASSNARDFFLRGPAYASGSNVPQLFPRGDGSAFALRAFASAGTATSVFGSVPRYSLSYFVTRDGKVPVARPDIEVIGGFDGVGGTPVIALPSTTGTRRAGAYEFAIAYPTLEGDQHVVGVTIDDGVTQRHVVAARNPNNLIFPVGFNRVGPSTYIGLGASYVYRDEPAPPGYSTAGVPGMFFFATLDAGETWFTFDAPELIASDQANIAAFANSAPYDGWGARYNDAISGVGAQFVPLTRTTALVWCLPTTIEFASSYYEMYRVRYGVADLEAGTVSLLGTMYEPPFTTTSDTYYAKAFYRYERPPIIAPGGGALVQFNDANYPASWTASVKLYHTMTGPLTLLGDMGLVAGKTGIPVAVSSSKLFIPAFDTEYSLYESVDMGITWTKRASVSDVAAAPVTGPLYQNVSIRSFANIVWLRDNGAPKNATPGAPWLSDDRLTQPV